MVATVTMFLGCQLPNVVYQHLQQCVMFSATTLLYTDKIFEDAGVKIFTCTPKIFATFLCDPWTRWTRRGVVSARAVTQLSLASGARWPVNSPLPRAAARRVRIHRGAATRQPRATGLALSSLSYDIQNIGHYYLYPIKTEK